MGGVQVSRSTTLAERSRSCHRQTATCAAPSSASMISNRDIWGDPLWFWADHEPPRAVNWSLTMASFQADRGTDLEVPRWTLNDHPIFMEWMQSGLVQRARYDRYMFASTGGVRAPLGGGARLKMNMFAWYFVDIDWQPDRERLQAAVDRLFIAAPDGGGRRHGFLTTIGHSTIPQKPKEFSYRLHPGIPRVLGYYIKRWAEFHHRWPGDQPAWLMVLSRNRASITELQQRAEIISRACRSGATGDADRSQPRSR